MYVLEVATEMIRIGFEQHNVKMHCLRQLPPLCYNGSTKGALLCLEKI